MDERLALIRDSIMPSLKEQDGFMGFVVLVDLEHDKSRPCRARRPEA